MHLQRSSLQEVLSAHKEVELTKGFSTNSLGLGLGLGLGIESNNFIDN